MEEVVKKRKAGPGRPKKVVPTESTIERELRLLKEDLQQLPEKPSVDLAGTTSKGGTPMTQLESKVLTNLLSRMDSSDVGQMVGNAYINIGWFADFRGPIGEDTTRFGESVRELILTRNPSGDFAGLTEWARLMINHISRCSNPADDDERIAFQLVNLAGMKLFMDRAHWKM